MRLGGGSWRISRRGGSRIIRSVIVVRVQRDPGTKIHSNVEAAQTRDNYIRKDRVWTVAYKYTGRLIPTVTVSQNNKLVDLCQAQLIQNLQRLPTCLLRWGWKTWIFCKSVFHADFLSVHKRALQVTDISLAYIVLGGFVVVVSVLLVTESHARPLWQTVYRHVQKCLMSDLR